MAPSTVAPLGGECAQHLRSFLRQERMAVAMALAEALDQSSKLEQNCALRGRKSAEVGPEFCATSESGESVLEETHEYAQTCVSELNPPLIMPQMVEGRGRGGGCVDDSRLRQRAAP